jgi:hypothetical protein
VGSTTAPVVISGCFRHQFIQKFGLLSDATTMSRYRESSRNVEEAFSWQPSGEGLDVACLGAGSHVFLELEMSGTFQAPLSGEPMGTSSAGVFPRTMCLATYCLPPPWA